MHSVRKSTMKPQRPVMMKTHHQLSLTPVPLMLGRPMAVPAVVNMTEYLAEISTVYTRILAHRVFKTILAAPPNPIRNEEGGECRMQSTFGDAQCTTALMRMNTYRASCNLFWLNFHRSVMPGVPLSIDRLREVVGKYWQSPKSFNSMVTVDA